MQTHHLLTMVGDFMLDHEQIQIRTFASSSTSVRSEQDHLARIGCFNQSADSLINCLL